MKKRTAIAPNVRRKITTEQRAKFELLNLFDSAMVTHASCDPIAWVNGRPVRVPQSEDRRYRSIIR